jgi:hypothetical protein
MVSLREQKKSQSTVAALRSLALKITSPEVGCPGELQRETAMRESSWTATQGLENP